MKEVRKIIEDVCSLSIWRWRAVLYFKKCGEKTWMMRPLRVLGAKNVFVGKNVTILPNLRLEIIGADGVKAEPVIKIGNGVNIEQNVHLTAAEHVYIGDNVSICGDAVITDIVHPYEDIRIAPEKQSIKIKAVNIGDNSFIGMHAMIMPGVTVGKHCVVGANSVVTHDVADYTVVAGTPAQVIKKFNFEKNKWIDVRGGGE